MAIRTRGIARQLGADTSGVSLLELTVVLPFLLTIGFGVVEFGNAIYNYHLITVGVRDGARYLAGLPNDSTYDQDGKLIAVKGSIDLSAPNRISWWTTSDVHVDRTKEIDNVDPTTSLHIYRGPDKIPIVRVWTAVTYPSLGLLKYFDLGPITLQAEHEERLYGNR